MKVVVGIMYIPTRYCKKMSRVEFGDLRGYTRENWHITFVRDTSPRK